MQTGANLIEIVSCSQTPFHIVVSENVVAVCKCVRVAIGLGWLSISSVNVCVGVEIDVVFSLGGSVTQIIEAWSNIFSETTSGHGSQ